MRWPWKRKPRPEVPTDILMVSHESVQFERLPGYLEWELAWDEFFRELKAQSERAALRQHYRKVVRPHIHRAAVRQA